jgi:hypothetical protein
MGDCALIAKRLRSYRAAISQRLRSFCAVIIKRLRDFAATSSQRSYNVFPGDCALMPRLSSLFTFPHLCHPSFPSYPPQLPCIAAEASSTEESLQDSAYFIKRPHASFTGEDKQEQESREKKEENRHCNNYSILDSSHCAAMYTNFLFRLHRGAMTAKHKVSPHTFLPDLSVNITRQLCAFKVTGSSSGSKADAKPNNSGLFMSNSDCLAELESLPLQFSISEASSVLSEVVKTLRSLNAIEDAVFDEVQQCIGSFFSKVHVYDALLSDSEREELAFRLHQCCVR